MLGMICRLPRLYPLVDDSLGSIDLHCCLNSVRRLAFPMLNQTMLS